MSKINVIAIDKEGNQFPKEIDRKDIEKYRQIAEAQGYNFRIEEPLTEEERVTAYPPVSPGQAFRGGILQGLTLGAEDEIFGKEETRTQQEAEKPIEYTVGKAAGSVITTGGVGALGAYGGAKLGAALGAAGGPIGAVGGGLLGAGLAGGLATGIESYMSQPEEEENIPGAIADAATATVLGVVPGLPFVRRMGKGLKAISESAGVPAVEKTIAKLTGQIEDKLLTSARATEAIKKKAEPLYKELIPAERTAIMQNLMKDIKERGSLQIAIKELQKKVGTEQAISMAVEYGIPIGVVQGILGTAINIKSPEQLAVLNRQAAERAYEEAVRKKTAKMLSEAEVAAAEQQVRKTVEEQTAERLKKLKK
jgi:hypothetical protein